MWFKKFYCALLHDLDAVVNSYSISLESDPETLELLAGAAARLGKRHKVLLVAELGDELDGSPIEEIYDLALFIMKHYFSSLELAGIAANFACLRNCLPSY